jgi:hypothetical protein
MAIVLSVLKSVARNDMRLTKSQMRPQERRTIAVRTVALLLRVISRISHKRHQHLGGQEVIAAVWYKGSIPCWDTVEITSHPLPS